MEHLAKKYRPRTLDDLLGQPKAVEQARALLARGIGGLALWIDGPSGVGKSCLAELLAAHVAETWNTEFLSPSALTPSGVADLEARCCLSVFGSKGGRALIVNEAHGLRRDGIRALKDALERIPKHVTWIFTTTRAESARLFDDDEKEDGQPLLDRCVRIRLTGQGLAPVFAARAKEIAAAEDLDGQPLERYVRLAAGCHNSLRGMLAAIQVGRMK